MRTTEIDFLGGHRKEAVEKAIELAKKSGRITELLICRDIPGKHTGGEDCFCDPKTLIIEPED